MTTPSQSQAFHLGDIPSIVTGLLVSPNHIQGVHSILDFVTGDTLMTHQIPRAAEECKPELLRQHPDLGTVQVPEEFADADHVHRWLAEQVTRFGETRPVVPMRPEDHTRIDPLAELAMMAPNMPVIPIVVNPAGEE